MMKVQTNVQAGKEILLKINQDMLPPQVLAAVQKMLPKAK